MWTDEVSDTLNTQEYIRAIRLLFYIFKGNLHLPQCFGLFITSLRYFYNLLKQAWKNVEIYNAFIRYLIWWTLILKMNSRKIIYCFNLTLFQHTGEKQILNVQVKIKFWTHMSPYVWRILGNSKVQLLWLNKQLFASTRFIC